MDPVELSGHLPMTTVMWYFDIHLFYLKQDKSFKPAFVFIDHQPDLVCKIASIEPDFSQVPSWCYLQQSL